MLNILKTVNLMNIKLNFFGIFRLPILFLLFTHASSNQAIASDDSLENSDYQVIQWVDLIPKEDLAALLNPPSTLEQIVDGSAEDSLENLNKDTRYGQALNSRQVISKFHNKKIRIPRFIVPIESDDNQRITSFFLVPYFGACLHLPPPPPNQIIYAKYPKGFSVEILYDPFWVEGTITTEIIDTAMGTSAYAMQIDKIENYDE